ncbi:MAG TPA: PEFG-CTERM sorting domain-containing protein [Candidatus Nitrosotalea sp.]|nr:PEFG-CTERM sorting domain-containing protein [Candidatus Nitrosotalea sp.]
MNSKKMYLLAVVVLTVGPIAAYAQTPNSINVQNTNQSIQYSISNGVLTQVIAYTQATHPNSLIILASGTGSSTITITLPRNLIDSKSGSADQPFIVTDDGMPVQYQESKTDTARTLTFSFRYATNPEIFMVTGTQVVPEFSAMTPLILVIAVVGIILVSANTKLRSLRG